MSRPRVLTKDHFFVIGCSVIGTYSQEFLTVEEVEEELRTYLPSACVYVYCRTYARTDPWSYSQAQWRELVEATRRRAEAGSVMEECE